MSKVLVAYFSCSGNTKQVAETLAQAISADIYEIAPKTPYTSADLDWTNKSSRSSTEMGNDSSRPEINDVDAHIENYNTVFIGFPIWWYRSPTIINTFLEKYDFSGKRIILFATSGVSGLGNSVAKLQPSAKGATFIEGKLLNGRPSLDSLKEWGSKYLA